MHDRVNKQCQRLFVGGKKAARLIERRHAKQFEPRGAVEAPERQRRNADQLVRPPNRDHTQVTIG